MQRLLFIAFVLATLPAAGATSPHPQGATAAASGKTRTYYIAADEVQWNYQPGGYLSGIPRQQDEEAAVFHKPTTFTKALYREYTDDTFTQLKPRPKEWEHLGLFGPVIRAEVGDTVKVVFKNNTRFYCSIHAHGLAYTKGFEGAPYRDGTRAAERQDDMIPLGKTFTYIWTVPERSGPGPGDPSSILWMYHSHVVETRELNSGLMGPIIVSARGTLTADGRQKDVDREFIIGFAVFDERESWYFDASKFAPPPTAPTQAPSGKGPLANQPPLLIIPDPREQYYMFSINGYIDSNLPGLTMKVGERVRWYLFANANEDDIHTVHWHGQTVLSNHMRTDTMPLLPMQMAVADMVPDTPGTWLLHCHNNDHMEGGMVATFTVLPAVSGGK